MYCAEKRHKNASANKGRIDGKLFKYVFFCNKSAAPVVDGLDPNGLIMYRLYRDATLYTDGTHVKVRIQVDRD